MEKSARDRLSEYREIVSIGYNNGGKDYSLIMTAQSKASGNPVSFASHALGFLGLLLLAGYLLTYGGRFHVIDEASIYAMSDNLARRGSLDTNQLVWTQWVRAPREVQGDFGPSGDLYSKKGFGASLLPALLIRLATLRTDWGLVYAAFFANALVTALGALVLAALVRRLGYRPGTALIMGGVYGLATLAMPYARTLFGEPTVALALLATLYGLRRSVATRSAGWSLAAGAALGLAICPRAINAPLIVLFALYLWQSSRDRRLLVVFLASSLACGLGGYAWYNAYRFGSPLVTGYQFSQGESFSTPPWIGFYGLLFSPFRGLFWFSPILLAAPFGIVRWWARHRWETLVALCLSGFYILLFSAWWMWWGGFAWGPRFLLPVVPFILLLTAPLWELPRARWALWGLALISLLVQILAVSADFSLTETVLENTFGHPESSAAMFDPRWSPILLQLRHLAQGFWDIAWKSIGVRAWPVVAGSLLGIILALIGLLAAQAAASGAGIRRSPDRGAGGRCCFLRDGSVARQPL